MTARRRGVSALALLLAAAAQLLLCVDAQLQISGQGATTLTPVMNIINFGFRSVNPDVVVTYTGTGSGAGRSAISGATQPSPSDFAGSNVVFTEGDVATSRKLQRAAPWSLIASTSAVVVAYTLPGLESKQLGTRPIFYRICWNLYSLFFSLRVRWPVIDRPTLVAIFNLTVKFWNDPAIASLQPPSVAALLPRQRINIVYRSDKSGTTNTFLQALNKFDPNFLPNPTDDGAEAFLFPKIMAKCPPLVLNASDPAMAMLGYSCPGKGSDQVAAQIAFHPYSIGYLSLTSLNAALTPSPSSPRPQQYFAMINRAGKTVDATTEACQEALAWGMKSGSAAAKGSDTASYTSPTGDLANGIDAPTPGAWPILEYNFLLVPDLLAVDCARSLQVHTAMWPNHTRINLQTHGGSPHFVEPERVRGAYSVCA
jgi:ABC-type phosphate transport system substrate-binding protein